MRKPLFRFVLPLALAVVLPFVACAEKANVFFVHASGSLTRSHGDTEFLCGEWLGTRQSADSSFLRVSVSPCENLLHAEAQRPQSRSANLCVLGGSAREHEAPALH